VTEWAARRKRDGDDYRVLCGRVDRVSGRSACHELVAMIVKVQGGQLAVAAPSRLTEQGTPGVWRVTAHAQRLEGERRTVSTNHGPQTLGRRIGSVSHVAKLPCTMPCPRGHVNRLDARLLDA